jgi:hypothetical protein
MTLVADGIYLPLMVKCFSLVEDAHDLIHIPSIVESFSFVKVLIANKLVLAIIH